MGGGRVSRSLKPFTVMLVAVVAAACSSPVASTAPSQSPADAGITAEKLVAELKGKSVEERTARLVELAKDAGPISLYADAQLDDSAEMLDAFSEAHDIEVSIYDGSTDSVRDRLLQEAEAGYRGAD